MSIHDYDPIITVDSVHDDGPLALYQSPYGEKRIHLDLGDDIVTTSDTDLAPLAKAILNAVEPDALVENQKGDPDDPRYVLATYNSTYVPDGTRSVGILDTVTGEVAGFLREDTPVNRAYLQKMINEGKAPGYDYSSYKRDIQRVTDEPTEEPAPTRRVASPKFPVGTRVEIVSDDDPRHINSHVGGTGTVIEPDDTTDLFYDIRVEVDGPDGFPVQFYNTEVVKAPSHKHVEGLYRIDKASVWVTHEPKPGYYTLRYLTEDDGSGVNEGMTDAVLNNYTLVSAA